MKKIKRHRDFGFLNSDIRIKKWIAKEVELRIHIKGYKNNPLNGEQKATNKAKSTFGVRVEHVFGFMPA